MGDLVTASDIGAHSRGQARAPATTDGLLKIADELRLLAALRELRDARGIDLRLKHTLTGLDVRQPDMSARFDLGGDV
jgi:hypothetical protein